MAKSVAMSKSRYLRGERLLAPREGSGPLGVDARDDAGGRLLEPREGSGPLGVDARDDAVGI